MPRKGLSPEAWQRAYENERAWKKKHWNDHGRKERQNAYMAAYRLRQLGVAAGLGDIVRPCEQAVERPERPCNRCGDRFQPTNRRRMLCAYCFKYGDRLVNCLAEL